MEAIKYSKKHEIQLYTYVFFSSTYIGKITFRNLCDKLKRKISLIRGKKQGLTIHLGTWNKPCLQNSISLNTVPWDVPISNKTEKHYIT